MIIVFLQILHQNLIQKNSLTNFLHQKPCWKLTGFPYVWTSFSQVGDSPKRALSVDRELAVPLKKRKKIYEESDICNVSTGQNLQKNECNEKVITSCPKFEKQNLCRSTPSASEKGFEEGKIEFNLQSSICVKTDDSAEWIKLKCFESTVDGSNGATFFAGGPIQSSAFSIMPHDMKVNQYVAIAASNVIYNKHSCTNTRNMSGIIQFWNVGSLHERKTVNQSPSMELALYHDNGMITQMKWCPAKCYDKSSSSCHLPRLGLLAMSSSNSFVYIYCVPQPDFMPKSKSLFPIYFTLPFMKLIPLFGGPSYITKKAVATCIDWEKSGDQVVAGYANGAVCVWMIKVSSFASCITVKNTKQSCIIQPYLFFQASGASISSLSFAPFNHRWLVVSSIDKILRFFDLEDTSAPFHVVKQGLENSCIWADTFCGVYSSPALNSMSLLSLFAKDCCAASNDKGVPKGYFDSSTNIAVSEKKNFHAIADMSGAVTVNFLKNISKPAETSYLTCMIFETEIMALDSIYLELKSSELKISISGAIPSQNELSSEIKESFYSKIMQGSSSSSSGFCSPKLGKTIVIETTQCLDDDAIDLLESPPGSSSLNAFSDINNNGVKTFLNESLNSSEESNDEMIKSSEVSGDLMHDLLMVKISNQSKSSTHVLSFNISNNSADFDSKGAKHLSDGALISSPAASDYTGDTIIYPFTPCFCDTSHLNPLKSVESGTQSESLRLNNKGNSIHETAEHKNNVKPTLKTELCIQNNLNFSSTDAKSGNSSPSENSSSKNWCELNNESCNLNYKSKNLKKINYDCDSFHSNDFPEEGYHVSKQFPKEIKKNGDTFFLNPDIKDNRPKPLPNMCSSVTINNFVICGEDDQQLSDRASIQSSAATDYSGETIIYFPERHEGNEIDANHLKIKKPGATFQSLYKSEKENTFQDTLLYKIDEKVVTNESNGKLLIENSSSFARKKCEHFLTKESLRCNSEYETESVTGSHNLSDEDKSFFPKDFLISGFQLLHSEYLGEKSEEKHPGLNELPKSDKNLEKLSYENLIANFGVIFKNNLDKSANPSKRQENDIYINNNPLSVIKTISWNPNEGCQSWLFVGGNSGIGRLVFVPDFVTGIEKSQPRRRHKSNVS